MNTSKTIIDKIWENHMVVEEASSPAVLCFDLHLIHEATSLQAFMGLSE